MLRPKTFQGVRNCGQNLEQIFKALRQVGQNGFPEIFWGRESEEGRESSKEESKEEDEGGGDALCDAYM